jgi:hypothetical protein
MVTDELAHTLRRVAHYAAACRAYPLSVADRQLLSRWLVRWRRQTAGIDVLRLRRFGAMLCARRLTEAAMAAAVVAAPGIDPLDRTACMATWDVFRRVLNRRLPDEAWKPQRHRQKGLDGRHHV